MGPSNDLNVVAFANRKVSCVSWDFLMFFFSMFYRDI